MAKAWDSSLVREMLARAEGDTAGGRASYRPDGLPAIFGMQADGLYRLSDSQAQEILQMRLQRLTGLEQDKIVQEYRDVMAIISDLLDILSRPERINTIITDELTAIRAEFGDLRRSHIELNATELDTEDLITPQDMVVTLSHSGYMKSQPISEYRAQSAAAAASWRPPPRKTTGSTRCSSPTRTTTSCVSRTAAGCTG